MTTRQAVNPVSWSLNLGFDQGQLIEAPARILVCSGQDAVDADGRTTHADDMAAQLDASLDNLGAVLTNAEMTFADVVRLNVYTTDFDALIPEWSRVTDRFGESEDRFVTSVLGVTRLFTPDLLVLIEATAVA